MPTPTVQLLVRLPVPVNERLRRESDLQDRTLTEITIDALDQYFIHAEATRIAAQRDQAEGGRSGETL